MNRRWYAGFCGNQWYVLDSPVATDSENRIGQFSAKEDAENAVLAHNAAMVMLQRGWTAILQSDGKWAAMEVGKRCPENRRHILSASSTFVNPCEALVEADRWYAEHVEGKP
jgi:hypothetical protein